MADRIGKTMSVLGAILVLPPFVVACVFVFFRRSVARLTVKRLNQVYGLAWGRRAEKAWEYVIIFMCIAFVVFGLLHHLRDMG